MATTLPPVQGTPMNDKSNKAFMTEGPEGDLHSINPSNLSDPPLDPNGSFVAKKLFLGTKLQGSSKMCNSPTCRSSAGQRPNPKRTTCHRPRRPRRPRLNCSRRGERTTNGNRQKQQRPHHDPVHTACQLAYHKTISRRTLFSNLSSTGSSLN